MPRVKCAVRPSRCTVVSVSPGITTCTSTSNAPNTASRCMATPISTANARCSSLLRVWAVLKVKGRPFPPSRNLRGDPAHDHVDELVGDLRGDQAAVVAVPAEQVIAHADHAQHHDARVHRAELT